MLFYENLGQLEHTLLINNNCAGGGGQTGPLMGGILSTAAATTSGWPAFVFALTARCNLWQNTAINRQLQSTGTQPPLWHTKLVFSTWSLRGSRVRLRIWCDSGTPSTPSRGHVHVQIIATKTLLLCCYHHHSTILPTWADGGHYN